MSLEISDITYAPRMEAFARKTSDLDAEKIRTDPVARSTALRQAVELIEPDWVVVSETNERAISGLIGETPPKDQLEFGEPDINDLAEVIKILADVRNEPIVPVIPDPVTLTLETFGEEWTGLLGTDEFTALDALHGASQLLSDVLREFDGHCKGVVLDATRTTDVLMDLLSLEDYLFEAGPLFNVADHHNVSVGGIFHSKHLSHYSDLDTEFDFVVFDCIYSNDFTETPSGPFGFSFPGSFWDLPDTKSVRQTTIENLKPFSSQEILLMQDIPKNVEPEYVQVLGEEIKNAK